MELLYQAPALDIKAVVKLLDIKTNTAAALVNDFVKYEVLEELTGKRRNRIFWFKDYIMIFKKEWRNSQYWTSIILHIFVTYWITRKLPFVLIDGYDKRLKKADEGLVVQSY